MITTIPPVPIIRRPSPAAFEYRIVLPRASEGLEGQAVEEKIKNILNPSGILVNEKLANCDAYRKLSESQLNGLLGMWRQTEAEWTQADIDAINKLGPNVARPKVAPKKARPASL